MEKLEDILSLLTNEELKQGYVEITEWKKTGELIDGIVRRAYDKYITLVDPDYPLYYIENPFLYEIARRTFK